MESAFGIDHGEIEKSRRTRAARRSALQANRAARDAKMRASLRRVGSVPGKVVNAKVSVADVGRTAGRVTTGVGRVVSASPAITGTAVIGGAGYGAYKLSQRPHKKKVIS